MAEISLTTVADPLGGHTSIQAITVTGSDVPNPDRLRRVIFIEGRWVASPADTSGDAEEAAEVVVGSTVVLNEKRMRVEARPGADPELVDENDEGYFGGPPEPEEVTTATQEALKNGLAAIEQVRKLALLPEELDASAAADALVAFCAAVTDRSPWEGPIGTVQANAVSFRLSDIAYEVQQVADLVQKAAEAWDDVTMDVRAIIEASRTGVGPDGSPELRFAHFDDEPEPEPENTSPVMNLVINRYYSTRSSTRSSTPPVVHRGVRESTHSTVARCGVTADYMFSQTANPVTCKRCLRLQPDDVE